MKIYYQSGIGNEIIHLDSRPYHMQTGDFINHCWECELTDAGDAINRFRKTLSEKFFLITVFGKNETEYYGNINKLSEIFERDLLNRTPGKLFFNKYYKPCYIFCSEKEDWEAGCDSMEVEFKFMEAHPFWIREHPHTFKASEITSTGNKGYPGRYPYRYASGLNNTRIVNEHYAESAFILRIYGPCVKPSVYIGGYEYHVDIVLYAGEYLEIDSTAETVTKVMVSGLRVNAFHCRSFKNSVFRPIQPGAQDIFWDGSFDFDLILLKERSEPKWS